jgi:hypothetical protein
MGIRTWLRSRHGTPDSLLRIPSYTEYVENRSVGAQPNGTSSSTKQTWLSKKLTPHIKAGIDAAYITSKPVQDLTQFKHYISIFGEALIIALVGFLVGMVIQQNLNKGEKHRYIKSDWSDN